MAQDYITRDSYGNIYIPEADPAFDKDYMTAKYLGESLNYENKLKNANKAANRVLQNGMTDVTDSQRDARYAKNMFNLWKAGNAINEAASGITRNQYRPDEYLERAYDDAARAQLGGIVAEILGSMFGYNQMKANEAGREVTASDIAMDILSNTPLFPLTSAYDIYDDYLNEGATEEAADNAKTSAAITAGLVAGIPVVGKVVPALRKGIKRIITNNKNYQRALENMGKYGSDLQADDVSKFLKSVKQ